MYILNYWNEREAVWKPAGFRSTDLDEVRAHQFQMIDDCGGCVRFRVIYMDPECPF